MPTDSIGIKKENNKTYILHKVEKGEGVYALGRKYGVNAEDIFAANAGADKGLKLGQVIKIPKNISVNNSNTSNGTSETTNNSDNTTTKSKFKTVTTYKYEKQYHKVVKGNTLTSIAKQYKTTVSELKKLNNLKSESVNLGQKLLVGEKKVAVKTQVPISEETYSNNNDNTNDDVVVDKKVDTQIPDNSNTNVVVDVENVNANTDVVVPVNETPKVQTKYSVDDGDEITEKGTAQISNDGELSSDRNFIYHPTAKIGTIVMITNPINNQAVFARVVGNCKKEDGVVLKLGKGLATKLGLNSNGTVTINYAL